MGAEVEVASHTGSRPRPRLELRSSCDFRSASSSRLGFPYGPWPFPESPVSWPSPSNSTCSVAVSSRRGRSRSRSPIAARCTGRRSCERRRRRPHRLRLSEGHHSRPRGFPARLAAAPRRPTGARPRPDHSAVPPGIGILDRCGPREGVRLVQMLEGPDLARPGAISSASAPAALRASSGRVSSICSTPSFAIRKATRSLVSSSPSSAPFSSTRRL
jgi:hypothetical protein